MKLVVAVSGGVDSVVLLDMLVRKKEHELVVAHFDHGIRSDSADDMRFVEGLAKKYGLPFEAKREELGTGASEELARTRRYAFLRDVATEYEAQIVTAHHMNDIAETIAINLARGTGWRGLAVLDSDIVRPLLNHTKADIMRYAKEHSLPWHEDSTNASDAYLRNRLRRKLVDETLIYELAALWARQVELKREIEEELEAFALASPYSRYFFTSIPRPVADEFLRHETQARLTPPQRTQALLAIATQRPGAMHQAGAGVALEFSLREFVIHGLGKESS